MADIPSFDPKLIQNALDAVARTHDERTSDTGRLSFTNSEITISGGCVSATIKNGKICVNLPLGLGQHCVSLPVHFPDGTAARACIKICTKFKIPTGCRLTVSIAGEEVYSETFGKC